MSKSDLERFVSDVKENKDLQKELKAVGADVDAIVKFATGKGYSFTADELKAYVEAKKGELTEEQLDKIAGGFILIGGADLIIST